MNTKRCGTCKFFSEEWDTGVVKMGNCLFPLPLAYTAGYREVDEFEINCPTWETVRK